MVNVTHFLSLIALDKKLDNTHFIAYDEDDVFLIDHKRQYELYSSIYHPDPHFRGNTQMRSFGGNEEFSKL